MLPESEAYVVLVFRFLQQLDTFLPMKAQVQHKKPVCEKYVKVQNTKY